MKKTSIAVAAAILWILVMAALYYWGHKPFDTAQALAIGRLLLDLLLTAGAVTLAGGIGRRCIRGGGTPETHSAEKTVLQAAAGFGVLSLLWLALGAAGLYYPITAWIVLAGGIALLWRDGLQWWKNLAAVTAAWKNGYSFDRLLILFLLLITVIQLIWAAAPPLKYDALSYHLQLPRQYIARHAFSFIPENPYWGHPQVGEMLFTWMMLLHRAQTAALLGCCWGILVLAGVLLTAQRVLAGLRGHDERGKTLPYRAGWIAAAALICGATYRGLMGGAYVDLLAALFGWAALSALLLLLEKDGQHWGVWAAVLCSFAIGVKWTGGITALVIMPALWLTRKRTGLPWRKLFLAAGLLILVVLPWLVKNIMTTGNPVYPYLFATQMIPEQRLQAASAKNNEVSLMQALLFPVSSTIFGFEGATGFGSDLGPLLALLAIPGLLVLRKQTTGKILLGGLSLCYGVILIGSLAVNHLQQTRLYFALLPWAAIAAAAGWAGLSGLRTAAMRVERLLMAVLLLVMVFCIVQETTRFIEINPAGAAAGTESPEDYLARSLGWYAPAVQSLQDLPQGSKALMLWEARGFYAPLNTDADLWIDRWRADYWAYGSAERVLTAWKAQGYTHMLFYLSGADLVHSADNVLEEAGWAELDRLLNMLPVIRRFGDAYVLYSLP